MELIYLIKDELTETELADVLINISLIPALGALVTTPKGIKVAQECNLDYIQMFSPSFPEVETEAKRISKESESPVAIIGPFSETVKEICPTPLSPTKPL